MIREAQFLLGQLMIAMKTRDILSNQQQMIRAEPKLMQSRAIDNLKLAHELLDQCEKQVILIGNMTGEELSHFNEAVKKAEAEMVEKEIQRKEKETVL